MNVACFVYSSRVAIILLNCANHSYLFHDVKIFALGIKFFDLLVAITGIQNFSNRIKGNIKLSSNSLVHNPSVNRANPIQLFAEMEIVHWFHVGVLLGLFRPRISIYINYIVERLGSIRVFQILISTVNEVLMYPSGFDEPSTRVLEVMKIMCPRKLLTVVLYSGSELLLIRYGSLMLD